MAVVAALLGLPPAAVAATIAQGSGALPAAVKLLSYDVAINDSGLSTTLIHARVQANNAAAAGDIGQQNVPYIASTESLDIVEAFTLKADGRKIPVNPSSIYEQPVPGSPQVPMFDDQRQKVIVFPDVQAGDAVDFTYRRTAKAALLPGHYSLALPFSRLIAYDDVEVTLTAPRTYPLYIATHEMEFSKRESGPNVTYHWHYAAPAPLSQEASAISPFESVPRILVSSFASYDDLSHNYAALVAPKLAVSSNVQQLADRIAGGVSGHRAQAQKIYDWVSRHIRYVGVEIGRGAIVPHDVDTVIANGYGDCKDHAALFASLLKAKGIDSQLVLINYENEYTLPEEPIIGAFNHVILWIPELGLFADTTSGAAPFGVLPFAEYGKPVLRVVASGPATTQIPVLPPGVATSKSKNNVRMDEDGRFIGHNTMTGTGPFAIVLRSLGLGIQSIGSDRVVQGALQKSGIPGTGSYSVPPPDNLDSDYTITADFSLGPFPELMDGRRFAMPNGLSLLTSPGEFLMGPLNDRKVGDDQPTACFSGNEQEDISLEIPASRRFLELPPDTAIQTPNLSFVARWSRDGQTVTLHREFTSVVSTVICSGELRRQTAQALARIRESYAYGIAVTGELTVSDRRSLDSLDAGLDAYKRNDYTGAIRRYSAVLASQDASAKTRAYAYLLRGDAYLRQASYDEAIADYAQGVKYDPSLVSRYPALARALEEQREFARAEEVLTSAIGLQPNSSSLYDERGVVRDYLGDHGQAAADFNRAIELSQAGDKVAGYYNDLATSYWSTKNLKSAIGDYAEAIRRDNSLERAWRGKGIAEFMSGRYAAAATDLAGAAKLDSSDLYSLLWLYLAESHTGNDARANLLMRTQGMDLAQWPGPLLRVLRGDLRPDEVVLPPHTEGWQTKRDECERDFYLAELALLRGDTATAERLFRATLDTHVAEYIEYTAASFELDRLQR